jgi:DNA-binding transcriptional ArsR family regulator
MAGGDEQAALRALAHPVRLRILSLLTAAPMTAAEVARELGITHANASYHLRNLLAGGLILVAGEEKIRGGVAKRYRYDAGQDREQRQRRRSTAQERRGEFTAVARELLRRTRESRFPPGVALLADAELWVEPEIWAAVRTRIAGALVDLHRAARPPRTPGTIRTSTSAALFTMEHPVPLGPVGGVPGAGRPGTQAEGTG